MAFAKMLIAVDAAPTAVRAAEVGIELAHSVWAEVALIHAVDPLVIYAVRNKFIRLCARSIREAAGPYETQSIFTRAIAAFGSREDS